MVRNLTGWCFPKRILKQAEPDTRPRRVEKQHNDSTEGQDIKPAQECVRMVPPLERVKLDVAAYKFYSDVFKQPQCNLP